MLINRVLKGYWVSPWSITNFISGIKVNLIGKKLKFHHIIREGKKLADYIANLEIDKGDYSFVYINNMEPTIRHVINSHKLKSPYLRVLPLRG